MTDHTLQRLFALLLAGGAAFGQTQVDLRTQARNVDFSQASSTRPSKTGTSLPALCSVGEMFFLTTAASGSNLYGCTATNTWAPLGKALSSNGVTPGTYGGSTSIPVLTIDANGLITAAAQVVGSGGGGAGMAAQLGDFQVDRVSSTQLRIGANCSTATPCNFRIGGAVTAITAPLAVNIVSATNGGKALIYVSNAGTIMAGSSAGLTLSCTGGCGAVANTNFFPADAIPLFEWQATTTVGQWNASGTDRRALLTSKVINAGTGLTRTDNTSTGVTTLTIDPSVIGIRVSVPPTSSTACTTGQWSSDTGFIYVCVATNSWRRAALGTW